MAEKNFISFTWVSPLISSMKCMKRRAFVTWLSIKQPGSQGQPTFNAEKKCSPWATPFKGKLFLFYRTGASYDPSLQSWGDDKIGNMKTLILVITRRTNYTNVESPGIKPDCCAFWIWLPDYYTKAPFWYVPYSHWSHVCTILTVIKFV